MIRSVVSGSLLLLAVLLLAGCGSKSKVEAQGDSPKELAVAPGDSSTPAPAVGKKPRSRKGGRTTRTADAPDAELMDMEERYKALVNRIRPGMTTKQVEAILGTPDDSDEKDLGELNPQKAGQTLEIQMWKGESESQSSIVLSFVNGKLQDGGTPGYDIRKGFKSKLPGNMNPRASQGGSEYEFCYQTGLKQGREHAELYRRMNASGKTQFRTTYLGILARFEKEYRSVARSYGEDHPATQQKKGIVDGYRKALVEGGIQ